MTRLLRSLLALVLLAAAALVGWRVLAPAEVLDPLSAAYPVAATRSPGVTGRTNMAPLIVDGRIRVFASKRQVRADGPVDTKGVNTAIWSFRRWPEQLSGVVAGGATVVSRWSDGELVAIDGRTGEIAWRAAGPGAPSFTGHRTGAQTVWAPAGLHVTGDAVVVQDDTTLSAYAIASGTQRWSVRIPRGCRDGFTTAGGHYVCPTGVYELVGGQMVDKWPVGPLVGLGCQVARSRCAGVRDEAGQGWLTGSGTPVRAPALDAPESTLAAGLVFGVTGGKLEAREPAGALVASYPEARVLGASGDRVVLLRPDRWLEVVDPRAQRVVAQFPLNVDREKLTFELGLWQVADGFVAIERLGPDGPASPEKPGHYFTVDTVIIAAV